MSNILIKNTARVFSNVFNPFLVPTLGFWIVLINLPAYELYSSRLKWIVMGLIIFTTCLIPLSFILLLSQTTNIEKNLDKRKDRILPYAFTAFSILMGAQLMAKLPVPSIFRLILLGHSLILVMLFLVTIRWKISGHMAAMGGIAGVFLALIFKYAMGMTPYVIGLIVLSGFVASSRMVLEKHTAAQVYAGYFSSLFLMYFIVYFF